MAKSTYKDFKGTLPIKSPYRLPENYAQVAQNCVFDRGSIDGLKDNTLEGAVLKATPARIFKCGAKWESWTSFVSVVRSWIFDSTSDRFYYTDGTKPKQMRESGIVDCTGGAGASTVYDLGIAAPAGTPTIAITYDGAPGAAIQATVAYVFTYVTSWGEESAPSPASVVTDIYDDGYVTLTCPTPTAERAAATLITKINIYRVASGTAGSDYQYLGEETIAAVTEDHIDRDGSNYAITPVIELGEVIQTRDYDPPPAALINLTSFANTMMAGSVSNKLYLTEPQIPYAFPAEYIKYVESDIVAIGNIGSSLCVATNTHPYIFTGTDPETMVPNKLNDGEKCVAQRGLVSTPYGVLYPSPNGLILAIHEGARNITRDIFTEEQWGDLSPSGFISFWYEEKYIAFTSGTNSGIAICGLFSDTPYVTTLRLGEYPAGYGIAIQDAYVDPGSRVMYLLVLSEDASYYILLFNQSPEGIEYSWTSRKENFPNPVRFGAGMVLGQAGADEFLITEDSEYLHTEASEYLIAAASGSGVASLKVFADGVKRADRMVPVDGTPWRLPSGYTARDWEFVFENVSARIDQVMVASTMDELKPWD
uniref:Putative structural protein n=1 Tax=viral metagenome TaxID=1070528 RepID=A0A6M3LEW1_9ZZZZ